MYLCQKLHWDGIAIISCQLLEKRQVYESCLDPFLGNFSAFDEEVFNSFALSQSLIFLSQMVDTDTQSLNSSICDFLTILHFQLSNKICYSYYHWSEFIKDKNLLSTFLYLKFLQYIPSICKQLSPASVLEMSSTCSLSNFMAHKCTHILIQLRGETILTVCKS